MPTKGQETREMILAQAAQLFSQKGYFGSSMSDIVSVTGMEKGGIYNHFKGKEALALEAFDYSVGLISRRLEVALAPHRNAADRLLAIVGVFRSIATNPPLIGGCPVLNTAIEADDAQPALRERSKVAMDEWRALVERIVTKGITRNEIRRDVDPDTLATLLISMLEGAVMMSKLYRDPIHMYRAVDHLTHYIETVVRA